MTKGHRRAVLKEEQAAVDYIYSCLTQRRTGLAALDRPQGWAHGDPASGTRFISELPRELHGTYEDPGSEALVFMRVDVQDDDSAEETFYIGRRSVKEPETDRRIVISWTSRAAIRWRQALASAPGEVRLRRRLRCEGSRVLDFSDDLVVTPPKADPVGPSAPVTLSPAAAEAPVIDDFLLQDLNRARGTLMRDIVETIERDQLMLVADERSGVLVIQGGPGTGKTAVGLHRVTWLLNPENTSFKPKDVLIVGPNREFLRYVSAVLPSLGNQDVTAVSIDRLWTGKASVHDELPVRRIKSDARMAEVLRRAVEKTIKLQPLDAEEPGDPLQVELRGTPLALPAEAVNRVFHDAFHSSGPYEARRTAAIEKLVDQLIALYRAKRPFGSLERRDRTALKKAKQFQKRVNAIWPQASAGQLLRQLFTSRRLLAAAGEGILTDEEQSLLLRPAAAALSFDDLVLLEELRYLLRHEVPRRYRHLVIDEAQDLTPMQARALARRCPSGSMTVLGDLTQATGPHLYETWEPLAELLAGPDGWSVAELTLGYRVPQEVMAFAEPLAAKLAPKVAFPRAVRPAQSDGTVRVLGVKPWQLLDRAIAEAVELTGADEADRSRSVALIVPDDAEWADEVQHRLDLARAQASAHAQAIRMLPAALAKGLEFDHVIVLEPASIAAYGPTGLHQLYIALTRCTQSLTIVHTQPLPEGLPQIPAPISVPPPPQPAAPPSRRERTPEAAAVPSVEDPATVPQEPQAELSLAELKERERLRRAALTAARARGERRPLSRSEQDDSTAPPREDPVHEALHRILAECRKLGIHNTALERAVPEVSERNLRSFLAQVLAPVPPVEAVRLLLTSGLDLLDEELRSCSHALLEDAPEQVGADDPAWRLYQAERRLFREGALSDELLHELPLSLLDELIDQKVVTVPFPPDGSERSSYLCARVAPGELTSEELDLLGWEEERARRQYLEGLPPQDHWPVPLQLLARLRAGDLTVLDDPGTGLPRSLRRLLSRLRKVREKQEPIDSELVGDLSLWPVLERLPFSWRSDSPKEVQRFAEWRAVRHALRLTSQAHLAALDNDRQAMQLKFVEAEKVARSLSTVRGLPAQWEGRNLRAYLCALAGHPLNALLKEFNALDRIAKSLPSEMRTVLAQNLELLRELHRSRDRSRMLNPYLVLGVPDRDPNWKNQWRRLRRTVGEETEVLINQAKDLIDQAERGHLEHAFFSLPAARGRWSVPEPRIGALQPQPVPLKRRTATPTQDERDHLRIRAARAIIDRATGPTTPPSPPFVEGH